MIIPLLRSNLSLKTNHKEFVFPSKDTNLLGDARRKFQERSLKVSLNSDHDLINQLFEGNVAHIEGVFFPKSSNFETDLIKEVIKDLILNPQSVEIIKKSPDVPKTILKYKAVNYELYPLLEKVKWDMIHLTTEELDEYLKRFYFKNAVSMSSCPIYEIPNCSNQEKAYLYKDLHDGEKAAIGVYKGYGIVLNAFLRDELYYQNADELLIHVAVLASALNKIPPSVDSYLYRSLRDHKNEGQMGLVEKISYKLKKHEKFKEKGFTSCSLYKPLKGFLGFSSENRCVKIYKNVSGLAKDISGIGAYADEFECLFLPNTKDLALREIVYENNPNALSMTMAKNKTHIFITKLVSKRLGVI